VSAGGNGILRASLPSCGLPCGALPRSIAMRTTDFCFPLLYDYEYPRSGVTGISSKLAPRPWPRARTRDQGTGGPGVSRRPIRFDGLRSVWRSGVLPPRAPNEPASGISVASGSLVSHFRAKRIDPVCRGRFARPSVKMRRIRRPEMPSTAGGCPRHKRETLAQARCGHVMFRRDLIFGAVSRSALMHRSRDPRSTAR